MDIIKKKRIVTKIGDVFCVVIDNSYKCYFQYIANDMAMLNSSVIRVFKTHYPLDVNPLIENIVKDEIDFHAHTILRIGITDNIWEKVGNIKDLSYIDFDKIIFCVTELLGTPIFNTNKTGILKNPLENWRVWKINGNSVNFEVLPPELLYEVEIEGNVLPYSCIIDKIKYGYYKNSVPAYDVIKRIPKSDVDSYMRKETVNKIMYYHFVGEKLVDSFVLAKGDVLKQVDNQSICNIKFGDINWKYWNFILQLEFDSVKEKYLRPSYNMQ